MHAHKAQACEMHAYEVHAYEVYTQEMHAHEVYAYETHARKAWGIKVPAGHRTPSYHVVIYVSESPSATLNSFNANSFQACLISFRVKNSIQSTWLWSRASGKRRQRTSL